MTMQKQVSTMIWELLSKGITTKEVIYDIVEKELDVPRPTVRRVAREVRTELKTYLDLLSTDVRLGKVVPDMDVKRN